MDGREVDGRNQRSFRSMAVMAAIAIIVALRPAAFGIGDAASSSPPVPGPDSHLSYEFMQVQDDGVTPVTYSSCVPIRVMVNPRSMPAGAEGVVEEAIEEIMLLTGLEFTIEGETHADQQTRRAFWEPVIVRWSDELENPDLAGYLGRGGSSPRRVGVGLSTIIWTTGRITLNGPALERVLVERRDGRAQVKRTVMHELGHLLGLDHTSDPSQVMHDKNYGQTTLQAGDRAGLARLGQGPCVRHY